MTIESDRSAVTCGGAPRYPRTARRPALTAVRPHLQLLPAHGGRVGRLEERALDAVEHLLLGLGFADVPRDVDAPLQASRPGRPERRLPPQEEAAARPHEPTPEDAGERRQTRPKQGAIRVHRATGNNDVS